MINFCYLDENYKNYEIFCNYITSTNYFIIDNKIQIDEIKKHLYINNIPIEKTNQEALNWIKENADSFRRYLDTLKIITIIWHYQGNDVKDLTFEKYLEIKNKLNKIFSKTGLLK